MSLRKLLVVSFVAFGAVTAPSALLAFESLPQQAPAPKDNPGSPETVELGKQLFFEPRISLSGTVSCNGCHNVMEGGDDDRPNAVGVGGKTGDRGAPTVWNAAFLSVQFWDGRAATLEDQAKGPMLNPIEMAMPSHDEVMARLRKFPGYVAAFEKAFGKDGMNIDNAAKAIAAYERTLITPNGAFDRYLRGDKKAISADAERGMKLFEQTGCTACHSGPAFAGPTLAAGTGFFQKFPTFADNPFVKKYKLDEDTGRFKVTGKEEDKHLFRVPTLRNIALTAPYFHNGNVTTLDEAVRVMAKVQLNKELSDADVGAIVAFLKSLGGDFPPQTMPRLPSLEGATVVGN